MMTPDPRDVAVGAAAVQALGLARGHAESDDLAASARSRCHRSRRRGPRHPHDPAARAVMIGCVLVGIFSGLGGVLAGALIVVGLVLFLGHEAQDHHPEG